jgi:hypothetical protein
MCLVQLQGLTAVRIGTCQSTRCAVVQPPSRPSRCLSLFAVAGLCRRSGFTGEDIHAGTAASASTSPWHRRAAAPPPPPCARACVCNLNILGKGRAVRQGYSKTVCTCNPLLRTLAHPAHPRMQPTCVHARTCTHLHARARETGRGQTAAFAALIYRKYCLI